MNKDEYFLKVSAALLITLHNLQGLPAPKIQLPTPGFPKPQATQQRCVCLLTSNQVIGFEQFPPTPSLSSPLISSPNTVPWGIQSCSRRDSFTDLTETPLLRVSMQHVAVDEEPTHNSTPLSHDTVQMLIQKSVEAKKHAYCVYSMFRVGAALLTADGSVYTGNWHVRRGNTCLCLKELYFVSEMSRSTDVSNVSTSLHYFEHPCFFFILTMLLLICQNEKVKVPVIVTSQQMWN